MKKYFYIIVLSSSLSLFLKSQTNIYHPLPDSNVYWCETVWWSTGTPPNICVVQDDYCLQINGDTIIGQYTYHKLFQSGHQYSPNCSPPGYYYNNTYKGAMRQDTANRTVYFLPQGNNSENLLYDFNLGVGDTLSGSANYVTGIDSVLVGTSYHKRFLLSPLGTTPQQDTAYALIEGIGSTKGLFQLIEPDFESGSSLNCFVNETETYPATGNICTQTAGLTSATANSVGVTFYPNPARQSLSILFNESVSDAQISIYNLHGSLVKYYKSVNGNSFIFSCADFSAGIYFARITGTGSSGTVVKFIVEK